MVSCWPVPKARPASISNAIAPPGRVAVGRRVDEEAPGADRLEPGLAHRHPIVLAELLDLGRGAGGEAGERGELVARSAASVEISVDPPVVGACGSGSSATITGGVFGEREQSSLSGSASASARVQCKRDPPAHFRGFLRQPLVERLRQAGGIVAAAFGVEQRLLAGHAARCIALADGWGVRRISQRLAATLAIDGAERGEIGRDGRRSDNRRG